MAPRPEYARRQCTSSLVARVSPESAKVVEVVESLISQHGRPFYRLPLDCEAFGLQAFDARED